MKLMILIRNSLYMILNLRTTLISIFSPVTNQLYDTQVKKLIDDHSSQISR